MMKAAVLSKTENEVVVKWEGESGFGRLMITYDGRGRYVIDAEYMSIDRLIEIIKAIT